MSMHKSKHMSKHVSKHMSKHVSKHMSKHVSEHMSKHVSKHMSKHVSKHMSKHVSDYTHTGALGRHHSRQSCTITSQPPQVLWPPSMCICFVNMCVACA